MTKQKLTLIVAVLILIVGIVYLESMRNSSTSTREEPVDQVPQGKLNINTVCEGALSYMTFPDGASAEVFVNECKEGKHPEVIEKYKQDMNLGDGTTI